MWGFSDMCTQKDQNFSQIFNCFIQVLFTQTEEMIIILIIIIIKLERVDDGPVLQLLYILLGLVKRRALLYHRRCALHKLHKIMTVHFVHDAKHASAMVTDTFKVLTFTWEWLSCWEDKIIIITKL